MGIERLVYTEAGYWVPEFLGTFADQLIIIWDQEEPFFRQRRKAFQDAGLYCEAISPTVEKLTSAQGQMLVWLCNSLWRLTKP